MPQNPLTSSFSTAYEKNNNALYRPNIFHLNSLFNLPKTLKLIIQLTKLTIKFRILPKLIEFYNRKV